MSDAAPPPPPWSRPVDFFEARANKIAKDAADRLATAWIAEGRPLADLVSLARELDDFASGRVANARPEVAWMHAALEQRRERGSAETMSEFVARMRLALEAWS